ncbi:MAG: U32 family peptidase [Proteobacteria bacterium]|nr:U32 family peptidase [Pseudomonadota bacterium]
MSAALELVCPAGTPAALDAAVAAGADTVYIGFRDATNARNFPGLNFGREEAADGISRAHAAGRRVYIAINTFPRAGDPGPWQCAVDDAAGLGADAIIVADIGLLAYAADNHPSLRRHLSVQASASNRDAIAFYERAFGVRRVVLPRVLTLREIRSLTAAIDVETEVFAFGGMCVMAEGRCQLSSYVTGHSPNIDGVCAPPSHVRYQTRDGRMVCSLGGFAMDSLGPGESAGYPTPCKGRFRVNGSTGYVFDEPATLNAARLLPQLAAAGIKALKIEGRQRGRAYVGAVVAAFRRAVDAAAHGNEGVSGDHLLAFSEAGRYTSGAYRRGWK